VGSACLQPIQRGAAESMVSAGIYVFQVGSACLQRFDPIHGGNGKDRGRPRRMPLVTRMQKLGASRRGNQ
jgi:hypothetical protein